jgi:hypothetical protein
MRRKGGQMPDLNLTPDLQAKLNEYHKALEAELKASEQLANDADGLENVINETFKEHTPLAVARIVWLAGNAESEGVQLKAAETILKYGLAAAALENDPFKQLLNDLTESPKPDTNLRATSADKSSSKR